LTSEHIAHWRMHSLRLSESPCTSPEEVVGWLGAVQSQDYGPAKWALGQRINGSSDPAIERASVQANRQQFSYHVTHESRE
jgi:hypothetical protein